MMETIDSNGQRYYPHVTAGNGDDSYARNSRMQRESVKKSFDLVHDAINRMELPPRDGTVGLADFGCGFGINSIANVEAMMKWLEERYEEIDGAAGLPIFQVNFQDVPTNDFNTLLQYFVQRQSTAPNGPEPRPQSKYFTAIVPGSFYSRMFPPSTLNIAFSSWALQWVSKIPSAVLDPNSPSYNRGNIHLGRSSPATVQAYAEQADRDLRDFLAARAEEMVPGGLVILIFIVRLRSDPTSCISDPVYDYEDEIMDQLVSEGVVEAEIRDSCNPWVYYRTVEESNKSVASFDSVFEVQRQEVLPYPSESLVDDDPRVQAQNVERLFRSVHNGVMEPHFGHHTMELLWSGLRQTMFERHTKKSYAAELADKVSLMFYSLRKK